MRCILLLLIGLLLPGAAGAQIPQFQGFPGSARMPVPLLPGPHPAGPAGPALASSGALCRVAIAAAERRWGVPTGLLAAIALVESGRADPATGQRQPWPWTVDAEGEGRFFDDKQQAIAWVRQQQAAGESSIDTGCMQVNLRQHPDAFPSLEVAFDPMANADYAARFLAQLHQTTGGDWMRAAGLYHSQTPELAGPYQRQVAEAYAGMPAGGGQQRVAASSFAAPGGGGQSLSNGAEHAQMLPQAQGTLGRGLSAYRSHPILLAGRLAMPTREVPLLLSR
jgi:hypothetical protein